MTTSCAGVNVDTSTPLFTVVNLSAGIQAGDRVVTKGSFALRAERERLALRAPGLVRP